MNNEERMKQLTELVNAQAKTIEEIEEHLIAMQAELAGFKFAFIHLIPFLPMSERDATNARLQALTMAEDATGLDESTAEHLKTCFATIQAVTDVAGAFWREQQNTNSAPGADRAEPDR